MRLCRLVLAALFAGASSAQQVLIVDKSGGTPGAFNGIGAAVQAAQDGDVVLVKGGNYNGFTVQGKSLVVTAERGANVKVNSQVRVVGLIGEQQVVLRGLTVKRKTIPAAAFVVEFNQGGVWVEDCDFQLEIILPGLPGYERPTVVVESSERVVFRDCTAEGSPGVIPLGLGFIEALPAIDALDSDLVLAGGTYTGGAGYKGDTLLSGPPADGGTGAPAVRLEGGFLLVTGATVTGGAGGDGNPNPCTDGGDGGPALDLVGGATSGWLQGAQIAGGAGGAGVSGCSDGAAGLPWTGSGGSSVFAFGGVAHALAVDSPLREGEASSLTLTGISFSLAVLVVGDQADFVPSLALAGVLLAQPQAVVGAGVLDAGGVLVLPYAPSPMPPGTLTETVFAQPVFADPVGAVIFGAPTALTILDATL